MTKYTGQFDLAGVSYFVGKKTNTKDVGMWFNPSTNNIWLAIGPHLVRLINRNELAEFGGSERQLEVLYVRVEQWINLVKEFEEYGRQ